MRLYIVLLYFLQTSLHVSDDTLIHHQEHTKTIITTSGTGRTVYVTIRWRGGVGTNSDSSTSGDGSKYDSTSARCFNYSL